MNAKQRIVAERKRQIEVEGFNLIHDEYWKNGELRLASNCYLNNTIENWPWQPECFKPKDEIRNLERAGALVMAERSRVLRMKNHSSEYLDSINKQLDAIAEILETKLNK